MNSFSKNFTSIQHIKKHLKLEQDPFNGGWFKIYHHDVVEQCIACSQECTQANSTTILRLFAGKENHAWFRVHTTAILNYISGNPLEILTYSKDEGVQSLILGGRFSSDQEPVVTIPRSKWRRVYSTGDWSLLNCLYTPGFEFHMLEVAKMGWEPSQLEGTSA